MSSITRDVSDAGDVRSMAFNNDEVLNALWTAGGKNFIFFYVSIATLFLISGILFAYVCSLRSRLNKTASRIIDFQKAVERHRKNCGQARAGPGFGPRTPDKIHVVKVDETVEENFDLEAQGGQGNTDFTIERTRTINVERSW